MQKWILFLFFLHPYVTNAADYVYDYNDNCSRAYRHYMSLHLQEGRAMMINEIKANPYNLMATYISDYEDYIVLLLNCDQLDYDQRAGHKEDRLELLEKGDQASPWFRFCKAGIYLHWAIVEMRFGEQYKAAASFHRSFALLKDNKQLFPDFEYNKVFTGLQEAVVGSLPGSYIWLASIFGMKGDMKKGTAKLADFINTHTNKQPLYLETILYYSYTRFYLLMEQKEVWNFLNSPQFPTHNDLLNTFAKVNIALDYRKSDEAIETLQAAAMDANYGNYPVFDYQMGIALLTRLDTNCISYFQGYLKKNKSGNFIKDTWQKMAFANYINNNTAQAAWCMEQVKTQGNTRSDADKQAKRFAENNVWPHSKVLQARFLIEGGYYDRALTMLQVINPSQLKKPADKLEYFFRLGKAYQESGDNNKALENYQAVINTGKERHEQFAARAALQMGMIYEYSGSKTLAISRYKECLNMPAHDFQNSIDQQAKAGINRLERE
ncbi:MAG: tetratricopeptide repeat protein [Chitinophagales bacterium]